MTVETDEHGTPVLNALTAAEIVGVHQDTLKKWARQGKVPGAWRTPGGWWKFTRAGLEQLSLDAPAPTDVTDEPDVT